MNKTIIIEQTIEFVKNHLKNAEGGHDWFHIYRVWKNAKHIGKGEEVDMFIVELGALLHDIGDSKFYDGDETVGPRIAREFLKNLNIDKHIIDHIEKIIKNISYKGGKFVQDFHSLELAVVQDADRLDALGAIGIARAFSFGGYKGNQFYNPEMKPNLYLTPEEDKKKNGTTVNHFYEKLLLLKNKMNTVTGKKVAEKRHIFMESYLEQFYLEWEGEI